MGLSEARKLNLSGGWWGIAVHDGSPPGAATWAGGKGCSSGVGPAPCVTLGLCFLSESQREGAHYRSWGICSRCLCKWGTKPRRGGGSLEATGWLLVLIQGQGLVGVAAEPKDGL